jgi:hypothetical protein
LVSNLELEFQNQESTLRRTGALDLAEHNLSGREVMAHKLESQL